MPVQVSTPLPAASTAPPKRRRIPITIVDDDTPQSQPPSSTSTNTPRRTDDDLLNLISSRTLSPSASTPPDAKSTPAAPAPAPAPTTQKPPLPPPSFKEAKQAREVKSVGRVGGGIFRMSGNDTVFKSREVPAPASPVPPAPALAASTPALAPLAPATPRTLFDFTRSWDHIPAADTAARWALLNVRTRHSSLARSAAFYLNPPILFFFFLLLLLLHRWLADDPSHVPPSTLRRLARTCPFRLVHPCAFRRRRRPTIGTT